MSDDLISRKEVITEIEINIGNIYNPDIIKGMKFAIDLINSRPTAFDKEKVIEKLKTNMNSFAGISGQAVTFMFSNGYYNGAKDAIEIVEKGGIE